jgi:spore germination protein KA
VVRTFRTQSGLDMGIVFIRELTDSKTINDFIMSSLLAYSGELHTDSCTHVKERILSVGTVTEAEDTASILAALFNGYTAILAEGWTQALLASTQHWERRSVEEPTSQTVIRGPKEGFTESLDTNFSMLRRRIKSPELWRVDRRVGRVTQTGVSVVYIKGIANTRVVEEVLRRIDRVDTDSILESGYLEEFIQDKTFTPFPTMMNTERPDTVAASLLEGQVAVLVDGTPFALIMPVTFFKFFLASEDYYQRFDFATFIRIIRFGAFAVSMFLPSLYIAITTFHQEMLPSTLLISLAAQREGVPFPAFFEALLMEITFEVLREAGVRMPRVIGPAVSIVGALVLGQAAVEAGLVSAAMVIVVSFTAISNFVAPAFNLGITARLIRFQLMLLAGTLGLFGIMSGLLFILIHMSGLRSFGVPYLLPFAPRVLNNWKDMIVRVPWWMMRKRPIAVTPKNMVRMDSPSYPEPGSHESSERDVPENNPS